MAINYVSGKMLQDNLERGGVDLSVETSLLYVDVTNDRIGVNIAAPTVALDVVGALKVSTSGTIGNVTTSVSTINSAVGDLILTSTLGQINASSKRIIALADPVNDQDAVTKAFLVSSISGISANQIIQGDSSLTVNDLGTGSFDWVLDATSVATLNSTLLDVTGGITASGEIIGLTAQLGQLNIGTNTITSDTGVIALNSSVDFSGIGINRILYTNTAGLTSGKSVLTFNDTTDTVTVTGVLAVDELTLDGSTITADAAMGLTTTTNGALTLTTGSGIIDMASTSAVQLPSSTTANRPGTPAAGMTRWNTTIGAVEYYDGATWESVQKTFAATSQQIVPIAVNAGSFVIGFTYQIVTTGDTNFTLIGAVDSNPGTIFTATGAGLGTGTASAYDFTLNKAATTDGILLSINGIIQDPQSGLMYSVTGTKLTFTSLLAPTDVTSIRFLEY